MTEEKKVNHIGKCKLTCMVCDKDFIGDEPQYCCDGRVCGCMGMPIYPVVCSDECYEVFANGSKLSAKNNPHS
jgi:hypothetical protein